MKYRKYGEVYVLRLEIGEEIITQLQKFCVELEIESGKVNGIGVVRNAIISYFDLASMDYLHRELSGNMEMNLRSSDAFSLIDRIKFVAQLRIPGETFQIITTYVFELGGTRRIIIPDVKIGNIPVTSSSRKDYVTLKFDFAANDGQILPSAA